MVTTRRRPWDAPIPFVYLYLHVVRAARALDSVPVSWSDDVPEADLAIDVVFDAEDEQFYDLEEAFESELTDLGLNRDLQVFEVGPFYVDLIAASTWRCQSQPEVVFDLPDSCELSGLVTSNGLVRLRERGLNQLTLVHELAHWLLGGRDGHSANFAGVYAHLVGLVFGEEAKQSLLVLFVANGIDTGWVEGKVAS